MGHLMEIKMNRLVNVLILFTSLGCKANCSPDPGMAYGFDNVSLGFCLITSSKAFKLFDDSSRLYHRPISRGHHVSMILRALNCKFRWITQTKVWARRQSLS